MSRGRDGLGPKCPVTPDKPCLRIFGISKVTTQVMPVKASCVRQFVPLT